MLKQHPRYDSIINWAKLISITGGAQIIVQAVGFLGGILIIRLLPIQEYALYTLANTMLGTMTLLADGGISTGVMAEGGKVWQNHKSLGTVVATGLELRKKFAIGSLVVAIPILVYLLVQNGSSWLTAFLIVVSLIPAFFAALSDSLLEISPKLHQEILPLQKNQVYVGLGRLALTAFTIFIFPFTYIAILASGIPRILGNIQLFKISSKFADKTQLPDPAVRKEILKVVKRVMPGAIYYCISGQLTIWLISIFGNTTAIAQIGALGRVSVLLGIFGMIFTTLLVPRFARQKSDFKTLLNQYLLSMILLFITCLVVILVIYLFSFHFLWILGGNYSGLDHALMLNIIGTCLSMITGLSFSLSSSRGWLLNPYLYISSSLLTIIAGVYLFDISTLIGVLYFNIFVSLIQMLIYISYSFIQLLKLK